MAALLRNVAVDGSRTEDSDDVGPSAGSAAGKASLSIVSQRAAALALYRKCEAAEAAGARAAAAASAAAGSKGSSAASAAAAGGRAGGSAAGAALDTVADLAISALTMPGDLVGKLLEDAPDPVGKPLGERSALLLLLLAHNLRATDASVAAAAAAAGGSAAGGSSASLLPNPFREALSRLTDSGAASIKYSAALPAPGALGGSGVAVPFKPLFTSLVAMCEQPLGVSLLYTLLQGSKGWCEHVLSRRDVDTLLLPLLAQLYTVPTLNSDHRYMLLITLLLFTQVRGRGRGRAGRL